MCRRGALPKRPWRICAKIRTYDLALLDVMLPGAGWLCLLPRRCAEFGWRGPIIMLTGRSSAAYKIAGLDCGADDYVTKPFDPAELLARVQAQLRRTREYDAPVANTRSRSFSGRV